MDVFTIQWGWIGGKPKVFIPIPPIPPKPVIVAIEERRWPGPSYVIYSEDWYFKRQQREEIEIIIL